MRGTIELFSLQFQIKNVFTYDKKVLLTSFRVFIVFTFLFNLFFKIIILTFKV